MRVTKLSLREKMILWVLGLYLLLNYGFMHFSVVVPPGELLLAWCIISVNWPIVLSRFHGCIYSFPFLLFWGLGFVRMLQGIPHYGFWAIRDASQCYESLFVIVGFVFASTMNRVRIVFRWWHVMLLICSLYGFLFMWRDALISVSPRITGGVKGAADASLLFNFQGTLILMIAFSASLIFKHKGSLVQRSFELAFAIAVIGYGVGVYQARTGYMIMLAATAYILVVTPRQIGKWSLLVSALILALFIISVTGIHIHGRLHQDISFDFVQKHFSAISGKKSEGVNGAAEGTQQRFAWWLKIVRDWLAEPTSFLFGQGYGFPLTDLVTARGIPVREPHNSAMSVLGRMGLVGIVTWLWIQILLVSTWFRAFRRAKTFGNREDVWWLNSLMIYFIGVWVTSMTEPGFELSFICIPYYFMWGVVIRYSFHLKEYQFLEKEVAISQSEALTASAQL